MTTDATIDPPAKRWCRFCHEETVQIIDPVNDHLRTCCTCWRDQKLGTKLEIGVATVPADVVDAAQVPTVEPELLPQDVTFPSSLESLKLRVQQLERAFDAHIRHHFQNGMIGPLFKVKEDT